MPPWVASGKTFNSLLSHEYLLVTSASVDSVAYYLILVLPLLVALRALGLGKVLQTVLLALSVATATLIGMVSGARIQEEGPSLVLRPGAEQVMAEIAGCLPGWLPERDIPNSCSREGFSFSSESWKRWFAIADKVANVAANRGCVYMSGGIENILACAADIPPTSLRTLIGFQTPHQLPSKRCQVTNSLYQIGIEKTIYKLPSLNYARGFREGTVPCLDRKSGQFTMVPVKELWLEDLKAYEAEHLHKK